MNCAHWTIKFCFFAPTLLLSLLLDFQGSPLFYGHKNFSAAFAQHQINLGSFSLQRSPYTGDLQLGLGQNANIFGFGADRQLGLNLGPGRFGAKGFAVLDSLNFFVVISSGQWTFVGWPAIWG